MKCLHYRVEFHNHPRQVPLGMDADGGWILYLRTCPACRRFVVYLHNGEAVWNDQGGIHELRNAVIRLVWPKGSMRPPCPVKVSRRRLQRTTAKRALCLLTVRKPQPR